MGCKIEVRMRAMKCILIFILGISTLYCFGNMASPTWPASTLSAAPISSDIEVLKETIHLTIPM